MNIDLKFRLTNTDKLSESERSAVNEITVELMLLAIETMPDSFVRVKIIPIENGEDDTAYVTFDGEYFIVVIDSRMPIGMIFDLLLHELAHVHSWHHDELNDHGEEFGKSYAYLYRKYLKLYEEYLT